MKVPEIRALSSLTPLRVDESIRALLGHIWPIASD
jgi:hypothetical protein